MAKEVQPIASIIRPHRVLKEHEDSIAAVAVFPDGCRMVTGSYDRSLRLWDLRNGAVLKKLEEHRGLVAAVTVSADGKLIASGDGFGELIAWKGDTGESLTQAIKGHTNGITSLDFSPDCTTLVTVSWDKTIKFWRTETLGVEEKAINVDEEINCVRYSPSGELVAIATFQYIQIWNPSKSECIATVKADVANLSLTWTPDGTRLISAGSRFHPTLREWDTSTWEQVGDPWGGHTAYIYALGVNSTGTLVASASDDHHVRLWRLSDRRTIATFKHAFPVYCIAFSVDGKYILSASHDKNLLEWAIPRDALLEDSPNGQVSDETLPEDVPVGQRMINSSRGPNYKILPLNGTIRDACDISDSSTAQELLTQQINVHKNNHSLYANRSFFFY